MKKIIGLVLLCAVLGVGGYFGYAYFQKYQLEQTSRQTLTHYADKYDVRFSEQVTDVETQSIDLRNVVITGRDGGYLHPYLKQVNIGHLRLEEVESTSNIIKFARVKAEDMVFVTQPPRQMDKTIESPPVTGEFTYRANEDGYILENIMAQTSIELEGEQQFAFTAEKFRSTNLPTKQGYASSQAMQLEKGQLTTTPGPDGGVEQGPLFNLALKSHSDAEQEKTLVEGLQATDAETGESLLQIARIYTDIPRQALADATSTEPYAMVYEVEGVTIPVGNDIFMTSLGYDTLLGNAQIHLNAAPADKTVQVEAGLFADPVMDVRLSADMQNVDLATLMNVRPNSLQNLGAAGGAKIAKLNLTLEDRSLVKRFLESQQRIYPDSSEEELVDAYVSLYTSFLDELEEEDAVAVRTAIRKFLRNKSRLALTIEPEKPLSFAELAITLLLNPQAAFDSLHIGIEAEGEDLPGDVIPTSVSPESTELETTAPAASEEGEGSPQDDTGMDAPDIRQGPNGLTRDMSNCPPICPSTVMPAPPAMPIEPPAAQ